MNGILDWNTEEIVTALSLFFLALAIVLVAGSFLKKRLFSKKETRLKEKPPPPASPRGENLSGQKKRENLQRLGGTPICDELGDILKRTMGRGR